MHVIERSGLKMAHAVSDATVIGIGTLAWQQPFLLVCSWDQLPTACNHSLACSRDVGYAVTHAAANMH